MKDFAGETRRIWAPAGRKPGARGWAGIDPTGTQRTARRFRGADTATVRGIEVPVATSPRLRLLGLAWLDPDLAPAGLLIPRCRSIHTFGMRFRIDVLFLGQDGRVIRAVEAVGRGRLLAESTATGVLEISGGKVAERCLRKVGSVASPESATAERRPGDARTLQEFDPAGDRRRRHLRPGRRRCGTGELADRLVPLQP